MSITRNQVSAMAFLSWAAYDHSASVQQNLSGSGWSAITSGELGLPTSSFNSEGFYEIDHTQAIVAKKGNTLVVAIRGSDENTDFVDTLENQAARYQQLESLFEKVIEYTSESANSITNLYVTGHSFGGAMAQYFAQFNNFAIPTNIGVENVKVATFGSPGTEWSISPKYEVYNFGHTQDFIYQHDLDIGGAPSDLQWLATHWRTSLTNGHILGLSPDQIETMLDNLHRVGVEILIDVPDGHWQDDGFAAEHSKLLYSRSIESLTTSIFATRYLNNPNGHKLIIDSVTDNADDLFLNLSSRTEDLLIIGDSGVSINDPDHIWGGSGDDWIDGGWGADTLYGSEGDDELHGRAGVDHFFGGPGDDKIYGGSGNDVAYFDDLDFDHFNVTRDGTTITVKGRSPQAQMLYGTDTLYDVQSLVFSDGTIAWDDARFNELNSGVGEGSTPSDGGSIPGGGVSGNEGGTGGGMPLPAGTDVVGNNTSEHLRGTSAGEAIFGNGGDDVLTGYAGQDSFDGGPGSDTVDYSYNPASVSGIVDLSAGTADFPGFYVETLTSIENIWMGSGDDTIYDLLGDSDLRGGPGDDVFYMNEGNNVIYGDWKYSDHGGTDTVYLGFRYSGIDFPTMTISGSPDALHIDTQLFGDWWFYNVENFVDYDGVVKTAAELLQGVGGTPSKIGSEFQVNTYTNDSQFNPSVATLADGGFIVTWVSNGQDGSGYGIFGQRYDENGTQVGGEFLINTYTDGSQQYPSVAGLSDGGFVVTWHSTDQDYSIHAQRYTSEGTLGLVEYQDSQISRNVIQTSF